MLHTNRVDRCSLFVSKDAVVVTYGESVSVYSVRVWGEVRVCGGTPTRLVRRLSEAETLLTGENCKGGCGGNLAAVTQGRQRERLGRYTVLQDSDRRCNTYQSVLQESL